LNIDETIKAIKQALGDCLEKEPRLDIREVYVGVAGRHIKSLQTRGDMVRENEEEEIAQREVEELRNQQYKTFIPAGDQIIDVIPQEYTVDNITNIIKPVGFCGIKLGGNFHIITGDKNAIRNIDRSVTKADLLTKDFVLQPLASADAVMAQEDLEAGVAIVDVGGGTTDLAVFAEGVLRHTAVIPFAGENITNDIKEGLGVLKTQAEQLKISFGSALANEAKSNAYITIPGLRGMPAKEIRVKNLAGIIQARMSEILDFVTYHLQQVGMNNRKLNGGIILTGGGSQLRHLIQLTEYVTGLPARLGFPNEHLAAGYMEELASPAYSTCLGLILKGYHDFENHRKPAHSFFINAFNEKLGETEFTPLEKEPEKTGEGETVINKPSIWDRFFDSLKDRLIGAFAEAEDTDL
jgi:cell division protein FtsA